MKKLIALILILLFATASAHAALDLKFSNFAFGTLAGQVATDASTLTMNAGAGALFPSSGNFRVAIYGAACQSPSACAQREFVTLAFLTGDTFALIERGRENTTAAAWPAGSRVSHAVSAEWLQNVNDSIRGQSGINTGDETLASLISKMGYTPADSSAPATTLCSAGTCTYDVTITGALTANRSLAMPDHDVDLGKMSTAIAAGTSVLGTSAIASGVCGTVVTTTAPNVATTDVVQWGFNGDPTAVTGYTPATSGMLTIISYPTASNVNFKVCNSTNASVTPGAITLNWRVSR